MKYQTLTTEQMDGVRRNRVSQLELDHYALSLEKKALEQGLPRTKERLADLIERMNQIESSLSSLL